MSLVLGTAVSACSSNVGHCSGALDARNLMLWRLIALSSLLVFGQAGDAAGAASTEARVIRGDPGTASVRLKVRVDGAGVQHVNHLS